MANLDLAQQVIADSVPHTHLHFDRKLVIRVLWFLVMFDLCLEFVQSIFHRLQLSSDLLIRTYREKRGWRREEEGLRQKEQEQPMDNQALTPPLKYKCMQVDRVI